MGRNNGLRPEGNGAYVEIMAVSDLLPGHVVWGGDHGWCCVLDDDNNDSTQVVVAPIIDDAGGQGESDILYGEWFLCVVQPPSAAGEGA